MLKKLQTKWKVSAVRLLLIIATFAIGGSLCGYSGRKLLGLQILKKDFMGFTLHHNRKHLVANCNYTRQYSFGTVLFF